MTNTVFDPGQVTQDANAIYAHVKPLNGSLRRLEATTSKAALSIELLEEIEYGAGIMGVKVADIMSFHTPEVYRKAVLETVYPFPDRFTRDAKLEVILSYLYLMILAFEKSIPYAFIGTGQDFVNANKLMNANVVHFSGLVKISK